MLAYGILLLGKGPLSSKFAGIVGQCQRDVSTSSRHLLRGLPRHLFALSGLQFVVILAHNCQSGGMRAICPALIL